MDRPSSSRLQTVLRSMPKYQASRASAWRKLLLSNAMMISPMDRLAELGDGDTYGHQGCVNALSWAQNGELLLSGSDDTTYVA